MTPYDINSELPVDFEKNMPVALVKCANYCVESDFTQAAKCLVGFAITYHNLFHSEMISIEHDKPSESGTRKLLEENYNAIRNLYQKEDTPYDHHFELKMFVKSGFLGALYWDYNSMLSDLISKMNELKKIPWIKEVTPILMETISQPDRSLLDIINSKVEIH